MEELKTLKEIEPNELEDYVDKRRFFSEDRIRTEAIKWIKAFTYADNEDTSRWSFEGHIQKRKDLGIYDFFEWESYHDIVAWIKHFFNIKEEELVK